VKHKDSKAEWFCPFLTKKKAQKQKEINSWCSQHSHSCTVQVVPLLNDYSRKLRYMRSSSWDILQQTKQTNRTTEPQLTILILSQPCRGKNEQILHLPPVTMMFLSLEKSKHLTPLYTLKTAWSASRRHLAVLKA
jgi:hypothetical protein